MPNPPWLLCAPYPALRVEETKCRNLRNRGGAVGERCPAARLSSRSSDAR
jgi:hypothetical protein